MSLLCQRGCGKCCEVGGTNKKLVATEAEALALAARTGRKMDKTAGRLLTEIVEEASKAGPCPFYDKGVCEVWGDHPQVCKAYQCNGEDASIKDEQSMRDSSRLASSYIEQNLLVADLRSWFPEQIASVIGRHTNIAFQFSGGKDSTALLLSMREWWDRLTVYHLDTGDMHPETREVVDRIRVMVPNFVHVQGDVFEVKRKFGLPSDIVPWTSSIVAYALNAGTTPLIQDRVACCYNTTMLPLHQRMREDGVTLIVRGQKNRDALKGALSSGDILDGFEFLYPASDWTDEQCFQIMRDANIPVPRYYTEGLVHSGDCMGCTAWCGEESRATYLKKYHPERLEGYRKDMAVIAQALIPQLEGFAKARAALC